MKEERKTTNTEEEKIGHGAIGVDRESSLVCVSDENMNEKTMSGFASETAYSASSMVLFAVRIRKVAVHTLVSRSP